MQFAEIRETGRRLDSHEFGYLSGGKFVLYGDYKETLEFWKSTGTLVCPSCGCGVTFVRRGRCTNKPHFRATYHHGTVEGEICPLAANDIMKENSCYEKYKQESKRDDFRDIFIITFWKLFIPYFNSQTNLNYDFLNLGKLLGKWLRSVTLSRKDTKAFLVKDIKPIFLAYYKHILIKNHVNNEDAFLIFGNIEDSLQARIEHFNNTPRINTDNPLFGRYALISNVKVYPWRCDAGLDYKIAATKALKEKIAHDDEIFYKLDKVSIFENFVQVKDDYENFKIRFNELHEHKNGIISRCSKKMLQESESWVCRVFEIFAFVEYHKSISIDVFPILEKFAIASDEWITNDDIRNGQTGLFNENITRQFNHRLKLETFLTHIKEDNWKLQ